MPTLRLTLALALAALMLAACASPRGAADGSRLDPQPSDPRSCIELHRPLVNDHRKFIIREPGYYCLRRDLAPRLELYHRPAEAEMILIRSDNVTLDLGGHTLGPALGPRRSVGIAIDFDTDDSPANVVIRNGVLSRLSTGITAMIISPGFLVTYECPIRDRASNTLHFPRAGITIYNVSFRGNDRRDFRVSAPSEMRPGTSEADATYQQRRQPYNCD